jgi:hypothetical protein
MGTEQRIDEALRSAGREEQRDRRKISGVLNVLERPEKAQPVAASSSLRFSAGGRAEIFSAVHDGRVVPVDGLL